MHVRVVYWLFSAVRSLPLVEADAAAARLARRQLTLVHDRQPGARGALLLRHAHDAAVCAQNQESRQHRANQ